MSQHRNRPVEIAKSPAAARSQLGRRDLLKSSFAASLSGLLAAGTGGLVEALATATLPHANEPGRQPNSPPRIAVVNTICFPRSHAHVILENFLEPYLFCGKLIAPPVQVASLFCEQYPANDIIKKIAADYKLPLYNTIAESLCCGGNELAVDGVVLIGEHGDYPENELGQTTYPRKRFFDEIVAVFKRSGRSVPVFNDKHLSHRWDWAKEMYDVSRELKFPFLAGSSVPLAQRVPAFELPQGAQIEEAVSIHAGPAESYGFHGLEVLEAVIEGRAGGETGVSRVQVLRGEAMWQAAKEGRWSPELASLAMHQENDFLKIPRLANPLEHLDHAFLLDYKDGTRGTVLMVRGPGLRWNFACKIRGNDKPAAFHHYAGPWANRSLFRALSHAIQVMFTTGKAPYSIERTLLTTGVLDAAMHSIKAGGSSIATPELEFAWQPIPFVDVRENGQTWKTITPDTPEPVGMKRDPEPRTAV